MGSYGKIDILDILIIVYFGQPKMIGVAPVLELPCDWLVMIVLRLRLCNGDWK